MQHPTPTASQALAPTIQTPALGAAWPDLPESVYAGVMRGEDGQPDYHLVVLPKATQDARRRPWGEYGKHLEGCTHRRDGLLNTQALAAAGSDLAAKALEAGHYIASQGEAHLIAANVHDLMPSGWYWTSTQYSPDGAWAQGFESGDSNIDFKTSEFRAVAVRRFVLQSFGPSDGSQ